jgi:hypothetical protein
MKKLVCLLPFAILYGCGTACDKAGDTITAKYESCGVEIKESDEEAAEAECDDAAAASAECLAACIDADDGGVLDATDTDYTGKAWTSYTECVTACAG